MNPTSPLPTPASPAAPVACPRRAATAARAAGLVCIAAVIAAALAVGLPAVARAAESRFTITPTPTGGVTVAVDGRPFAGYVVDQGNKPFLWPVHGPTGTPLTRAFPMLDLPEEPAAQRDHPHHRGITFGHESIGGIDTWHERATYEEALAKGGRGAEAARKQLDQLGAIRHRGFTTLEADDRRAVVAATCDHVDHAGVRFLTEERRMTFRVAGDTRLIDWDQDLVATDGPVRIDARKDAGLSIRVPVTMAVDVGQGGRIENAEGLTDKEAWGKRSRWVDYRGPVAGEQWGVAMLNHPTSFRHPTGWHVRGYGLFTANPFADFSADTPRAEPVVLAAGGRIRLRHRFVLHPGDPRTARIAEAYETYAAEPKE